MTKKKDEIKIDGKTTSFDDLGFIKNDLDISKGDSNQVMAMAAFQNMGKAVAEDDIMPPGANYLLHNIPNILSIYVHKESKINYYFVIDVANIALSEYEKDLERKRAVSAASPENKAIYDVPIWILFDLALNRNVHPLLDEKEFEQVLWDVYPKLWLDESKAPKRIIT